MISLTEAARISAYHYIDKELHDRLVARAKETTCATFCQSLTLEDHVLLGCLSDLLGGALGEGQVDEVSSAFGDRSEIISDGALGRDAPVLDAT